MIEELKKDYAVNNKGKRCMVILFIYRLGNKVLYSGINKHVKHILLIPLNILNQLFVFLPFKIELPFSCKIGGGCTPCPPARHSFKWWSCNRAILYNLSPSHNWNE